MAALSALVVQGPAVGTGIPTARSPWRFSVEVAAVDPDETAWSVDEWGPDDDSGDAVWEDEDLGFDWVDITGDVRGIAWSRGADEAYGRTRTGTATLELDNSTNRYSPWALDPMSPFVSTQQVLGPGTVVRWGYHDNTGGTGSHWRPQFCGIVKFWDTESEGGDADRWAEIPLVETAAFLANIDEPERTPVGAADLISDRIPTLIADTETGWPFGDFHFNMFTAPFPTDTLQATTMAGNRLAELHLSTDSVSGEFPVEFCADRQGRPLLRAVATRDHPTWDLRLAGAVFGQLPAFAAGDVLDIDQQALFDLVPDAPTGSGLWIPLVCTYRADALVRRSTHENVINWVSIAAEGGTATVTEDVDSRTQHGRRTFQRHDLICQPSSPIPALQAQRIVAERAWARQEVRPLTVYADESASTFDVVTITDSQEAAVVFGHTPSNALLCRVRTIDHRIRPHPGGLLHEADFTFDVIDEIEPED